MIPLLLLLALGCLEEATPVECIDHGECEAAQACIAQTCQEVQCLDSSSCNLDEYCDTETFACRIGCLSDDDCGASQTCSAGSCEDQSCRSSDLDCPVGEFCDESSGECVTQGQWCVDCSTNPSVCGDQGTCLMFQGQEPSEAVCYNYCDSNADCPAGFSCTSFDYTIGAEQVTVDLCYANCTWLSENGWM